MRNQSCCIILKQLFSLSDSVIHLAFGLSDTPNLVIYFQSIGQKCTLLSEVPSFENSVILAGSRQLSIHKYTDCNKELWELEFFTALY